MIVDEIVEILTDDDDAPVRLNQLADEFRDGRDIDDLVTLLFNENEEVLRMGTWIASEISFTHYDSKPILEQLWELTAHPNAAVRLYSFNALFPSLSPDDDKSLNLITRLMTDLNEGVKMTAKAAARSLSID